MNRLFQSLNIRTLCTALLTATLLFCNPAHAISNSTDHSGLWWNTAESGWGANVTQQEQLLFITLFVYGANSAPTWYVASSVSFTSANAAGDRTYTGKLYATTGSGFALAPFVTPVGVVEVGTITFVGKADGSASLAYSVNGAMVSKNIVRQTFAQPNSALNVATAYSVQDFGIGSKCPDASLNGQSMTVWTTSTLYINGSNMTLSLGGAAGAPPTFICTYSGTNYTQEGRYGRATLIGRCKSQPPSWVDQTLTVTELEIGQNIFTAQYANLGGPSATCFQKGAFSGIKFAQ